LVLVTIIATTGTEQLSRLTGKQNEYRQLASLDGHGERAGAPRYRIKLDAPQAVIAMAAYDAEAEFWDNAFIWSLRCTGYKGDIVLMVTPKIHQRKCSERLKQWFIDMEVVTVPYELVPPGCPTKKDLDKVEFVEPRCFGIFEPEVTRYLYNGQILEEMYPDPETRVFLPDYRDVIYQVGSACSTLPQWSLMKLYFLLMQAGPFSMPELEDELMVFTEDETIDPGYWAWTDHWVKDCWGEPSSKLMHGKPVLNSGSVMGTKQGVGALVLNHMLRGCRLNGQKMPSLCGAVLRCPCAHCLADELGSVLCVVPADHALQPGHDGRPFRARQVPRMQSGPGLPQLPVLHREARARVRHGQSLQPGTQRRRPYIIRGWH
jgi:hypothetical protein